MGEWQKWQKTLKTKKCAKNPYISRVFSIWWQKSGKKCHRWKALRTKGFQRLVAKKQKKNQFLTSLPTKKSKKVK